MASNNRTIAVTGATGQLGSAVLQLLIDNKYPGAIVATSRNPANLKPNPPPQNVVFKKADFNDSPDVLAETFKGVDRVLFISSDDLAKRDAQHRNAVEAFVKAGVKHVVYTSCTMPAVPTAHVLAKNHFFTEELIKSTGLGYTFLRNNLYLDVIEFMTIKPAITHNAPVLSVGEGKYGLITRADCAKAGYSALVSTSNENKVYNISGAQTISYKDATAIASSVIGRTIPYASVSREVYIETLGKVGVPQEVSSLFATIHEGAVGGDFDVASNDFEKLTGEKAKTALEVFTSHKDILLQ